MTVKRAAMRAGAQINGFLSSEKRPSACKRGLGGGVLSYPHHRCDCIASDDVFLLAHLCLYREEIAPGFLIRKEGSRPFSRSDAYTYRQGAPALCIRAKPRSDLAGLLRR